MAQSQDIQTLIVSFEARLNKFNQQMAKLQGDTNSTLSNVEKRFARTEGLIGEFGKKLSGAFVAERTAEFIKGTIEQVARLGEEAKKAGLSVEAFQAALFAGRRAGLDTDQMVQGFAKLNLNLGQAAQSGNELGKILKANNIALSSLNDPITALKTIADLYRNAATAADRAVIGQAAFGKEFRDFVPLLSEGSAGIQDQIDKFGKLGQTISSEVVEKFKEFKTLIDEAGEAFKSGVAREVLSTITDITNLVHIAEALVGVLDKIQAGLGLGTGDVSGGLAEKGGAGAIHDWLFGPTMSFDPAAAARRGIGAPRGTTIMPPAALTEEQKKASAAAEEQAKKIARVITELQLQDANLSRTAKEQEVYNELAKAGVDINSEAGKRIAELARKYADDKEALHNLTDEMDAARDAAKGFTSDLISGLREGKSLTEALGGAFQRLADKMLDRTLDQIFNMLMGKPGTLPSWLMPATGGGAGGFAGNQMGAPGMFPALPAPAAPGASAPLAPGPAVPVIPAPGIGGILNPATQDAVGSASYAGMLKMFGVAGGLGRANPGMPHGDYGQGVDVFPYPMGGAINAAAAKYGLDPNTFAALVWKESRFNQSAISPKGAIGFTQLMPGTAKQLGVNPYDPTQNLEGGAHYLSQQINRFGSTNGGLAAYNMGPRGYSDFLAGKRSMPAETTDYVQQINVQSAKYAQAVTNTATTAAQAGTKFDGGFTQGLDAILQAVGGGGAGGGGLGGIFGGLLGLLGAGGTQRASGGPVLPGRSYTVGEAGPERLLMGRGGGMVIPSDVRRPSGRGGLASGIQVHVTRSKYFDVAVREISGAGDVRTLDSARRSYPEIAARHQKLGTTTR